MGGFCRVYLGDYLEAFKLRDILGGYVLGLHRRLFEDS
jgi:hypothetical protein